MDPTVSPQLTVQFTFVKREGRITEISTNHPALNHFLDLLKLNRAYNTWLNYAHDLKLFFAVIHKPFDTAELLETIREALAPAAA